MSVILLLLTVSFGFNLAAAAQRLAGDFLPAAAFAGTREGGGYGLSGIIEHTARKYGGDAYFRYNENAKTFTTRIRLNLHPETL